MEGNGAMDFADDADAQPGSAGSPEPLASDSDVQPSQLQAADVEVELLQAQVDFDAAISDTSYPSDSSDASESSSHEQRRSRSSTPRSEADLDHLPGGSSPQGSLPEAPYRSQARLLFRLKPVIPRSTAKRPRPHDGSQPKTRSAAARRRERSGPTCTVCRIGAASSRALWMPCTLSSLAASRGFGIGCSSMPASCPRPSSRLCRAASRPWSCQAALPPSRRSSEVQPEARQQRPSSPPWPKSCQTCSLAYGQMLSPTTAGAKRKSTASRSNSRFPRYGRVHAAIGSSSSSSTKSGLQLRHQRQAAARHNSSRMLQRTPMAPASMTPTSTTTQKAPGHQHLLAPAAQQHRTRRLRPRTSIACCTEAGSSRGSPSPSLALLPSSARVCWQQKMSMQRRDGCGRLSQRSPRYHSSHPTRTTCNTFGSTSVPLVPPARSGRSLSSKAIHPSRRWCAV
ncbi:uncharacterized protein PFL1_03849 [Pseudozyma flocculosa PF-1]|uniref:Uncharacterized protein n=1 Tax=Pseudozyma flocculosa PF-1 TaxID=1277687 RepID=A0A061H972_9BASI|nr:uncharacterized protein PFL1_03849 [Pseudozyma flocculosa PF-1]EPQ28545.1 hypothetical protein PFL1_03849 [Pseudozyma flocculosa PF-1]